MFLLQQLLLPWDHTLVQTDYDYRRPGMALAAFKASVQSPLSSAGNAPSRMTRNAVRAQRA
jgi:hypothetical protein